MDPICRVYQIWSHNMVKGHQYRVYTVSGLHQCRCLTCGHDGVWDWLSTSSFDALIINSTAQYSFHTSVVTWQATCMMHAIASLMPSLFIAHGKRVWWNAYSILVPHGKISLRPIRLQNGATSSRKDCDALLCTLHFNTSRRWLDS